MKKFALDVNIPVLTLADRSPLFKKVEADTESIVALADALPLSESNVYVAGDPALEALPAVGDIERRVFAELPVQAGLVLRMREEDERCRMAQVLRGGRCRDGLRAHPR